MVDGLVHGNDSGSVLLEAYQKAEATKTKILTNLMKRLDNPLLDLPNSGAGDKVVAKKAPRVKDPIRKVLKANENAFKFHKVMND